MKKKKINLIKKQKKKKKYKIWWMKIYIKELMNKTQKS